MTGVAAQNTLRVTRVDALSPEAVTAQMEAVVKDMGMVLNGDMMAGVAAQVATLGLPNLVVG
ncbi:bifunctional hydroxymethylpyrimidine kinase/phosphomethylpyrimidine kinase [[Phormidium] sp. ETS-05]|uniref:bifunctional hydroxymethylpyrimidine kinase/phosphomethylpyrimidine kinase n=1 Tax=[Phormidium] sp. ETS-05 TaxID=222819 RepID=UPI001E2FF9E1|nr:bifunctional hydroxymethylpyrimidine kinase/phosphomethylpyrimidine kinase [[Phormidium] sp. ETS-05]